MIESVTVVSVSEAKTQLSRLLERVAGGEEIAIARRGEVIARLVPTAGRTTRRLAVDEGLFTIPDDFNAPLPQSLLDALHR
ncbi:MAG TPA: type II toxin-antitoxin system prevent-host-death family antitoxin [Actinomycetes bacterium]|nr:type II toxin-antitoxin system prevent-host-death family antitoxin [Actinomycetes bacterium]